MFSFFKRGKKLPNHRLFALEPYKAGFSLDRLAPGVDNIRYDVRLSPELIKSSATMIRRLVAACAGAEDIMELDPNSKWTDFQQTFETHYSAVLLEVIDMAKMRREIQIDYLAHTALAKQFIGEMRTQFEHVIDCYINAIRTVELSSSRDIGSVIRLRERLSVLRSQRAAILRNSGIELFQYLTSVQEKEARQVREINFGTETVAYEDIFANPILHVEDAHDDFFMMDEYGILLGRRFDDPDRYAPLIDLLRYLFSLLFSNDEQDVRSKKKDEKPLEKSDIDNYLKQIRNIDLLLNFFDTAEKYATLKKKRKASETFGEYKNTIKLQKAVFGFFYRHFDRAGLVKRIVASNRMREIARMYCPPLVPQLVVLYLTVPRKRRSIVRQLKRSGRFFGKKYPLQPLRRLAREIESISGKNRKIVFLDFLKGFIRYHRDLENFKTLKEGMDYVNITSDEKTINLSRTNNTLFEFLLPREAVLQEKPVINHTIIKADVRGSTEITKQMVERGLNPASYFSLNFFDPITEVLSEYGAAKVFIEGDAIILSITEHEQTPKGWYAVARACGLASNMLAIVNRCNANCGKNNLPKLELGIGITFNNNPPTYLFDENNKIMISPAINQADRLSSCAKPLRKKMGSRKPFNLYVFQAQPDKSALSSGEEVYLRFNVNGIELSMEAFNKLNGEIEMRRIEAIFPDVVKEKIKIYLGKFPTANGKFKKLVVREAPILEILTGEYGGNLKRTSKNYYEVVSNPRVIEYVDKLI